MNEISNVRRDTNTKSKRILAWTFLALVTVLLVRTCINYHSTIQLGAMREQAHEIGDSLLRTVEDIPRREDVVIELLESNQHRRLGGVGVARIDERWWSYPELEALVKEYGPDTTVILDDYIRSTDFASRDPKFAHDRRWRGWSWRASVRLSHDPPGQGQEIVDEMVVMLLGQG